MAPVTAASCTAVRRTLYIKLSSLPLWPVYFSFSKVILANRQSKKYYLDNIEPSTVFYDAKGKSVLEHARAHRACIEN